jgi:hypothetical protein
LTYEAAGERPRPNGARPTLSHTEWLGLLLDRELTEPDER